MEEGGRRRWVGRRAGWRAGKDGVRWMAGPHAEAGQQGTQHASAAHMCSLREACAQGQQVQRFAAVGMERQQQRCAHSKPTSTMVAASCSFWSSLNSAGRAGNLLVEQAGNNRRVGWREAGRRLGRRWGVRSLGARARACQPNLVLRQEGRRPCAAAQLSSSCQPGWPLPQLRHLNPAAAPPQHRLRRGLGLDCQLEAKGPAR